MKVLRAVCLLGCCLALLSGCQFLTPPSIDATGVCTGEFSGMDGVVIGSTAFRLNQSADGSISAECTFKYFDSTVLSFHFAGSVKGIHLHLVAVNAEDFTLDASVTSSEMEDATFLSGDFAGKWTGHRLPTTFLAVKKEFKPAVPVRCPAFDGSRFWFLNNNGGNLFDAGGSFAKSFSCLYSVDDSGTLTEVDLSYSGGGDGGFACAEGALWALERKGAALSPYVMAGDSRYGIMLPGSPQIISSNTQSLWVLELYPMGVILKIDPITQALTEAYCVLTDAGDGEYLTSFFVAGDKLMSIMTLDDGNWVVSLQ